jgi:hypothetical protein
MKKALCTLGDVDSFSVGRGCFLAARYLPWRNNAAPFNFLFGNEIDTHQQSRLTRDGNLFGFFYIEFTGVVTKDL